MPTSPNASTWRYLGKENFKESSCCHLTASFHPAPPVDCVEDMADYEETDGGDEEVVEVETTVGLVGLLDHHSVKVSHDGSDVCKDKVSSIKLFSIVLPMSLT